MARKVQTHLIDDLDGSDAAETITFALDAKSYEIDLNETHALELRAALAPYIAVATRLARRPLVNPIEPRSDKPSRKIRKRVAQEVREWARSQGIEVGDKGRLSADLLARYEAAQRGDSAPTQFPAPVSKSGEDVDLMGALQDSIRRNQELGLTAESEVTLGTDEVRTVAIPGDDWDDDDPDEIVDVVSPGVHGVPSGSPLIPAFLGA